MTHHRLSAPLVLTLLVAVSLLAGCASERPVPSISLQHFVAARRLENPPLPVKIIEVPQALPLPGQIKLAPDLLPPPAQAPQGPRRAVRAANAAALIRPSRATYLNAMQVWPYTPGALYQVYTSPERVTDIELERGEQLVSVSAGDTVRWVIGNTTSGEGRNRREHILVKPIEAGLHTNLLINTSRRTYHLELVSTPRTWMAAVSWRYPLEQLIALRARNRAAEEAAPLAERVNLARLNFRYRILGNHPSWRPVRVFDDGRRVYIEFSSGIAEGEMPPLFILGPKGGSELINYQVRPPYYIVDRLFAQAELRLGSAPQQIVKITRTDLRADTDQGGGA